MGHAEALHTLLSTPELTHLTQIRMYPNFRDLRDLKVSWQNFPPHFTLPWGSQLVLGAVYTLFLIVMTALHGRY